MPPAFVFLRVGLKVACFAIFYTSPEFIWLGKCGLTTECVRTKYQLKTLAGRKERYNEAIEIRDRNRGARWMGRKRLPQVLVRNRLEAPLPTDERKHGRLNVDNAI
ncbi:hypothetical protein OUZ56_032175 [Daphnia magna]|uniref:Secreted protein n=1 Tax=Daphnia magna TaxID=35525 RepID=A0ABQ9ZWD3_9CRUS|nr:hypothetical protein OUZ56_032175 [Daphnia magna]